MGIAVLDLPYVAEKRVKGYVYVYYRRDGKYIELPAADAPNFREEYDKIHASFELTPEGSRPGSVKRLIEDFKASANYTDKAPKTRKDYDRYLSQIETMWGDLQVTQVTRRAVFKWRDALKSTPRTANYAMQVARLLFNFSIDLDDEDSVKVNPARRPKKLKTGPGHKPWPDDAITKFVTTEDQDEMMILALAVGLYTGLREQNCIKLNKSHYDGKDVATVADKNGELVWIPAVAPLRDALGKAFGDRFMALVTKTGRPFKADNFRHRWRAAILKAGLDGYTFHGLRTTAATILAEWCTDAQLMAIFGWRDPKMPAHYRRLAQNRKLAAAGMAAWEQKLIEMGKHSN